MVIFRGFFVSLPEGIHLVGGAITILKNMSSSIGRIIPYMKWKIKKHVPNHQPVICLTAYVPYFALNQSIKDLEPAATKQQGKLVHLAALFTVTTIYYIYTHI